MFVKRGSLRVLKRKCLPYFTFPSNSAQMHQEKLTEATSVVLKRKEYSGVQRAIRSFLGLDIIESRFDSMNERFESMNERFDKIDNALDYLLQNGLMKEDICELAVVIDAKRGIFLSDNNYELDQK